MNGAARFASLDADDAAGRLMVSDGVVARDPAQGYVPGAFVPKLPWRACEDDEVAALVRAPGERGSLGGSVSVVPMDPDAVAPLRDLALRDDVRDPALAKHVARAIDDLRAYLGTFEPYPAAIRFLYARVSEAGAATTSRDERSRAHPERLAGLHVDSWERRPLAARHLSRNRLCINLGQTARHLLFVRPTLAEMAARLERIAPLDRREDYRGMDVVRSYLSAFPNTAVYRLATKPGEAYIFPTENIAHDASTADMASADVSCAFSGFFSSPQTRAAQPELAARGGGTMAVGRFS